MYQITCSFLCSHKILTETCKHTVTCWNWWSYPLSKPQTNTANHCYYTKWNISEQIVWFLIWRSCWLTFLYISHQTGPDWMWDLVINVTIWVSACHREGRWPSLSVANREMTAFVQMLSCWWLPCLQNEVRLYGENDPTGFIISVNSFLMSLWS